MIMIFLRTLRNKSVFEQRFLLLMHEWNPSSPIHSQFFTFLWMSLRRPGVDERRFCNRSMFHWIGPVFFCFIATSKSGLFNWQWSYPVVFLISNNTIIDQIRRDNHNTCPDLSAGNERGRLKRRWRRRRYSTETPIGFIIFEFQKKPPVNCVFHVGSISIHERLLE